MARPAHEVLRRRSVQSGECWLWTGSTSPDGYGRLVNGGRSWAAHRLAYATWVGPIPDGHEVHHQCLARNCIRPEHLMAVPADEHHLHHQKDPKIACPHGHAFDEANTYVNPRGRRICRKCTARQQREYQQRKRSAA